MEGLRVTDCRSFLISNGTFQNMLAPVSPSNGQGNCKIKKKIMILRKGARGLPNTMKIAQIRKNLSLYGMVPLDKKMSEKEVRLEVAKKFYKLDDIGYKFGAADKFGRLNFHEGEEWTAANIGKWAKKASVLYIVPEVELDDGSGDSDDSSDESNRSPIQRPTAEVKSEPVVLASLPGSLAGQHEDPKRPVLSKANCGDGNGPLPDSAISGSSHDETMEVNSVTNHSDSTVAIFEECLPQPFQDYVLGIGTDHLWDPFEGDDYYNTLYGPNAVQPGEVLQPQSHDVTQGVPQGKPKPASPAGTSTSSGIEEDKSDSSVSLEPAEPEQWPKPINYISEMSPDRGPMKGGSKFMILLEQDLPSGIDFPVRVKFGDVPDGVVKAYLKNHVLTGSRIPASPVPGVVRVVVETQGGQYIGETEYTYEEDDKKAVLFEAVSTCDPKVLSELFHVLAGRMKSFAVTDDGSPADCKMFLQQFGGGHLEGNTQNQILNMLEVMVYLAAQVDGRQFVKIIFNSPLGKVLFKSYKEKSTQPQDIARENGHHEIAQYLEDIHQRFQQSDQDYPEEIEQVDWESVIHAVQKLTDDQNQENELYTAQLCDEESDDDYCADDEATFSGSSDDEEQVLITVNKDPAYVLALRKLKSSSHPNILSMFASGSVPSSITVFASRETLVAHLQNAPHTSLESRINIAQDITRALSYLQHINLVHRDIRAENVLITNTLCQLAITKTVRALDCKEQQTEDEGDHSHVPDEPDMPEYISREVCGTEAYMAPEVIEEGRFSFCSDIYSLGCVLLHLLTNKPASDILQASLKSKVKEKEHDVRFYKGERVSTTIDILIESCWKDNRRERPSPCDILNTLDKIRSETLIPDNDCVPRMKTDPMGHSDTEPTLKPINQVELMMESFEELSKVPTEFEILAESVADDEDYLSHLSGGIPSLSTQMVASQSSLSERKPLETKISSTPGTPTPLITENDMFQNRAKGEPYDELMNNCERFAIEMCSGRELESPGMKQEAHSSKGISGDICKLLSQVKTRVHVQQNGEIPMTEQTASNDTSRKTDTEPWTAAVKPGTAGDPVCRATVQPSTASSKLGTTFDSSWTSKDKQRDTQATTEYTLFVKTKNQPFTTESTPGTAGNSPWATKDQSRSTMGKPGSATDTPCRTRDEAWTTGSKLNSTDNSLCKSAGKPCTTASRTRVQPRTTASRPSTSDNSPWITTDETWTKDDSSGAAGDTCKTTTDYKQCTTTSKPKVASKRSRVTADKDKASKDPCEGGFKTAEESRSEQDGERAGSMLSFWTLSLGHLFLWTVILVICIVALFSWFSAPGDCMSSRSGKHNIQGVTTFTNYERGSSPPNLLNCFPDLRRFWSCCFPMQHPTALKDLKTTETFGQKLPYSPFVITSTATKLFASNRQMQSKQVNQTTRKRRHRNPKCGCKHQIGAKYVTANLGYGKSTGVNQLCARLCQVYGQELCTTMGWSSVASCSRRVFAKGTCSKNKSQCSTVLGLPSSAIRGATTNENETIDYRSVADNQQQTGYRPLSINLTGTGNQFAKNLPAVQEVVEDCIIVFDVNLAERLKLVEHLESLHQMYPRLYTRLPTPLIPSSSEFGLLALFDGRNYSLNQETYSLPRDEKESNEQHSFPTNIKLPEFDCRSRSESPSVYFLEEFVGHHESKTTLKGRSMTFSNLLKIVSKTKEITPSDAEIFNYERILESCKRSVDLQKHFQVFFRRRHQSETKLKECILRHLLSLLTRMTITNKETNSASVCEKGSVKQGFCPARTSLCDYYNQNLLSPSMAHIKGYGINQQGTLASHAVMGEFMRDREGQTGPRRPTDDTTWWTAERVLFPASRGVCKQ